MNKSELIIRIHIKNIDVLQTFDCILLEWKNNKLHLREREKNLITLPALNKLNSGLKAAMVVERSEASTY